MPAVALAKSSGRAWAATTSVYNGAKFLQTLTTLVVLSGPDPRVTVLLVILVVSMIAISFPAISSSGMVRVPNILFFIGKHFGTGVILATAFIHLLPDSFNSLLDDSVKRKYGNVGKWIGLIILGSLLTIFLVEYISTTFVEHLQAEPSAASTPHETPRPPLPSLPHTMLLQEPSTLLPVLANSPKIMRLHLNATLPNEHPACSLSGLQEDCLCQQGQGHDHRGHDHSHRHADEGHRVGRRRQIVGIFVLQVGIMIHSLVIGLTLSITSGADFTSLTTAIIFHQIFEGLSLGIRIAALPPVQAKTEGKKLEEEGIEQRPGGPSISELEGLGGIAKQDPQHVIPHQASIPYPDSHTPRVEDTEGGRVDIDHTPSIVDSQRRVGPVDSNGRLKTPPSHSNLDLGSKCWFSLGWRGGGSLFRRSPCQQPIIHHHDGYGGTSHGERCSSTETSRRKTPKRSLWSWQPDPLKTTLSVLFAVTTPLGMVLGLTLWKGRENEIEQVSMKLIQGVMSAISAGMLIYAATVEMIAGDFVFGDLEGHHHHHGGSGGEHEHEQHHHHPGEERHPPSISKRATAVLSLLFGVMAMVLIGLGEPTQY